MQRIRNRDDTHGGRRHPGYGEGNGARAGWQSSTLREHFLRARARRDPWAVTDTHRHPEIEIDPGLAGRGIAVALNRNVDLQIVAFVDRVRIHELNVVFIVDRGREPRLQLEDPMPGESVLCRVLRIVAVFNFPTEVRQSPFTGRKIELRFGHNVSPEGVKLRPLRTRGADIPFGFRVACSVGQWLALVALRASLPKVALHVAGNGTRNIFDTHFWKTSLAAFRSTRVNLAASSLRSV